MNRSLSCTRQEQGQEQEKWEARNDLLIRGFLICLVGAISILLDGGVLVLYEE